MKRNDRCFDLKGRQISLAGLDNEERALACQLQKSAKKQDCETFNNYWIRSVVEFYDRRGLKRKDVVETALYKLGQDLKSRLMISAGLARTSDYRDELEILIHSKFESQRAFCKATGLSEDLVRHVLSGRKHLTIDSLTTALRRIGYDLRIVPCPNPVPARVDRKVKRAV